MVPDYIKALTSNANLWTLFYMEGGGIGVTLTKR
jgi:hypothetical protein